MPYVTAAVDVLYSFGAIVPAGVYGSDVIPGNKSTVVSVTRQRKLLVGIRLVISDVIYSLNLSDVRLDFLIRCTSAEMLACYLLKRFTARNCVSRRIHIAIYYFSLVSSIS